MARVWNRYPYTDLHELNMSFCLDKITEFEARLTDVEEDVADLKTRMTSVEGRMTTAEERIAQHDSDIAGLSSAVGGIRNRVTALENADIQDAAMLESVFSVVPGGTSVTVNFNAATYENGVKREAGDTAVIPKATESAAGVIVPGDQAKLNKMTLSGDDVIFAGKVSGDAPTSGYDYCNKNYVDSLAISGSATVSSSTVNMLSTHGTPHATVQVISYGKIRWLRITGYVSDVTSEIGSGTSTNAIELYCDLSAGDAPYASISTEAHIYENNVYVWPGVYITAGDSGRITVYNQGSVVPVGGSSKSFTAYLMYIVA